MATHVAGTGKFLVPICYQDQRHEVILRENCSRRRFLKVVEQSIPELPEGILILQRYEKCEKRESTNKRLELTCGSELLLLDPEQVQQLEILNPVSSSELSDDDSEKRSDMKAVINGEGAYFDEDSPNLTLQALADAQYYLPEDLLLRLQTEYGAQALPNARVLTVGQPVLRSSSHLIWTDLLGEEYIEFMRDSLKIFEKLIFAHQTNRNERNIRSDLYEPLFTLAGLHKRAGISGGQKLSIHAGIEMATSEGKSKFSDGLKPDLCDGWLLKHSINENQIWRLVGPHEKLIEGRTGPMLQGLFGEDKFMGIDLLVELKKQDKDADKYEVWLEAIGSLLCFNKDFQAKPVIFCGTCNQLDVRFYSVANTAQTEGQIEQSPSPAVKFVIQNLFSLKIVDIDSFLQFSMFLWRMKQFRRKQFDLWAATLNQAQPDFDIFALKKPVLLQNSVLHVNTNTRNSSVMTDNSNTNINTGTNEEEDPKVEDSFAQLNFVVLQRLRQNMCAELWCGKVNGVEVYLKANIGTSDVANERSIYSYLQGKGFPHISKMLGSYTCEAYDVILIEKVNGEHIEYLSNKLEVTLYAYKLLKVLEGLHALNVAHGDIKPSNIVYCRNNHSPCDLSNIKLIDFGFAQMLDEGLLKKEIRGYSHGYSSRELFGTGTLALSDDIYSAGIIIGQLICDYAVRDFGAHEEISRRIGWVNGNKHLKSLVRQMIAPRTERPSASQLLKHKAFKELLLDAPFGGEEMKPYN